MLFRSFHTSFRMPWRITAVRDAAGHARHPGATHHVVPRGHDALHVQIAWEERDIPVRHDLAVLDEDAPEVAHHRGLVADFEARADRDLVAAARDDLPCEPAVRCVRQQHALGPRGDARTRGKNEFRVSVIE